MKKIYFTEEARREAERLKHQRLRAAKREFYKAKDRDRRPALIRGRYDVDEDPPLTAEMRSAQEQWIARVERAAQFAPPGQWLIGNGPRRPTQIDYEAMLG